MSNSGVDFGANWAKGFLAMAFMAIGELGIQESASTNILLPLRNSILKGINWRILSVSVSYDFIFPLATAKFGL